MTPEELEQLMGAPPLEGWPLMSGLGEEVLFWVVAALMVLAAVGVMFFRKAAYAALSMVALMVGMAVLFVALQAPFNGVVQVIVYTGAIMMLFLFVIMMIGLGATDGFAGQRRGYIWLATGLGVALAVMLVAAVLTSVVVGPGAVGGNPYSNQPVTSLAVSLFSSHWLDIQLAAMLLIVAAVGAVLLTHSDRLRPKFNQARTAEARMREYAAKGIHVGQNTAPGVFAKSNAVDNPAIAGDTGAPIEESIPRVLRLRGLERPLGAVSAEVAESLRLTKTGAGDRAIWSTKQDVPQSAAWGMPGAPAPRADGLGGLRQVTQSEIAAAGEEKK